MGTINFSKLTGESFLPPFVSRGRPRESCPRDYSSLSSFFPRPSCLSPRSPISLAFNQRDYEKKWSLKLSSLAPRRQAFNIPKRRGAWAPAYVSTEQHLHGFNDNRGSAGRGPTGGDQRQWRFKKKKRQRQNHAHHWQQFTRAQLPGGQFPVKFVCQPIKLELYPPPHAYPANYVRVHLRHLGVYKESRVA